METKLTISALLLLCFGPLKCTNEFKINLPIRAEVTCDEGFVLFNGNCYKLTTNNLTFDLSQQTCQSFGSDANLASIWDAETNDFLTFMVKAGNAFLGLQFSDVPEPDNYTWPNGTVYSYSNFPDGYDPIVLKGLGTEVMLQGQSGQWINKDCSSDPTIPFICQKPAHPKPTEQPPTVIPPNTCPAFKWEKEIKLITSPGYPHRYNGESVPLNCTYVFYADTEDKHINITFTELSTCGTGNSVISIYEGMSEEGKLINKFTGDLYNLPAEYTSKSQFLFMRFTSNGQGKWRAEWETFIPAPA